MKVIQQKVNGVQGLKAVLKRVYGFLKREPALVASELHKEIIGELVGRSDPTILEIGCNDGGNTAWFLDVFENPEIFCFEPDPRAISRFNKNIGYRPEVHLFQLALSNIDGETTFYMSGGRENEEMPEGWDASGSIREPKKHLILHPWCKFNQTIIVKTRKLDTWSMEQDIKVVDFIWMDVQGAEMDVIRGGKDTLMRTRFLYTEYSNKELYKGQINLKQLLKELRDFEVLARYPNNILLRNRNN